MEKSEREKEKSSLGFSLNPKHFFWKNPTSSKIFRELLSLRGELVNFTLKNTPVIRI